MARSRQQNAAAGFIPVYGSSSGRKVINADTFEPNIKPVASATDPYTPVRHTPKSPLFALAEALKEFEGSLGGLIKKEEAKTAEADALRGEAAFLQGSGPEHAEAVSGGLIPPQASPHFVAAYKEAEGRHTARNITTSLAADYDAWEGKDTDETGTAFTDWSAERLREKMQGLTDPAQLKGAIPALRQSAAMLHKQHQGYVAQKATERAVKGVASDVAGAIDGATAVPMIVEGRNTSYGLVKDSIRDAIRTSTGVGLSQQAAEAAATDTVLAQAIARRDDNLLDALPEELAANPRIAAATQKARDSIAAAVHRDEQQADTALTKRRKEVSDESYRAAIDMLGQDKNAELPEALLEAGTEADPQFRIKVEDLRQKMLKINGRVSDEKQNAAQVRIHRATDDPLAQAIREIENGNITDPGRVGSALSAARQLERSKGFGEKSVLSGSITKQYEKVLKEHHTKAGQIGLPSKVDEAAYGSTLTEYHLALTEWEEANPKATSIQRMKAQREIGEEIVKGLKVGSTASPAAAPPAAAPATPATQPAAPQAVAPVASPAPAGAITPEAITAARASNPGFANVPEPLLRKLLEKQAAPAPAAPPAQAPAPAPQAQPVEATRSAEPAPAPGTPQLVAAPSQVQRPPAQAALPARLQQAVSRLQDAQAQATVTSDLASNARFERIAGTPFSVGRGKPETGPVPQTPPVKNTYKGATYPPRPGEKFEAPDLDIAYAAKPSAQYGIQATKKREKVSGIVFHHTASPDGQPGDRAVAYGQTVDRVRGGSFGYHFYVDREGNIVQGAPLTARTNHLKDVNAKERYAHKHIKNENSIGISLIGTGANPTPAQLASAQKLGSAIAKKLGIDPKNVVGHGETQRDRSSTEGQALAKLLRGEKD